MAKILIAGFLHETNTFSAKPTTFVDFEQTLGYPGLILKEAMLTALNGRNLPSSGFIQQAKQHSQELVPVVWCSAPPYGIVSDDAFEKISDIICDAVRGSVGIDAIYLDLHGAMVSESYQDSEGELLKRIREICGYDIPIAISLDLHANVSEAMLNLADVIEVFRTCPHIDMFETGERIFHALMQLINNKFVYLKRFIKLPYLIPFTSQCTLSEPGLSIYQYLEFLAEKYDVILSFAMGNTFADVVDCCPSLIAYGFDEVSLEAAIESLLKYILQRIYGFKFNACSAADAVSFAMAILPSIAKPVVIADIQDNPNSGGSSDTTGLLRALLDAEVKNAIVAILCDPEVAALAHKSGIGAYIHIALGGKFGVSVTEPLYGRFKVIALNNGEYQGVGRYTSGTKFNLGPMALLEINGVQVVVSSKKTQAADPALFYHLGVEPKKKSILVLKSSINFRADFTDIAGEIILAQSPGDSMVDPKLLSYKYVQDNIQILV
jgi:microcystin degradation protein MlrC